MRNNKIFTDLSIISTLMVVEAPQGTLPKAVRRTKLFNI